MESRLLQEQRDLGGIGRRVKVEADHAMLPLTLQGRSSLSAARHNEKALGLFMPRRSPEIAEEPATIRLGPDAGYNQR